MKQSSEIWICSLSSSQVANIKNQYVHYTPNPDWWKLTYISKYCSAVEFKLDLKSIPNGRFLVWISNFLPNCNLQNKSNLPKLSNLNQTLHTTLIQLHNCEPFLKRTDSVCSKSCTCGQGCSIPTLLILMSYSICTLSQSKLLKIWPCAKRNSNPHG